MITQLKKPRTPHPAARSLHHKSPLDRGAQVEAAVEDPRGIDENDAHGPAMPASFAECGRVYQSAWVARVLAASRPKRHVDISATPWLAAIASAFVPVDFHTPEPSSLHLSGVRSFPVGFGPLGFVDFSLESLSCSGIIETLGLPNDGGSDSRSDLDAMAELKRVLAPDGSLMLICPIGKPGIVAGSRVYSFGQVLDAFDGLELEEFSLVPDGPSSQRLLVNPDRSVAEGRSCGSGCFWFRRPRG
jgi:hypothetical protein